MTDAVERLVNLALFLASSRSPKSARECRAAELGYPAGQDEAAFLRMFERDKDALRASGLAIEVVHDEEVDTYRLDPDATFARPIDLTPAERSSIRAVAAALSDDPAFPFGEELRMALGKLGTAGEGGPMATGDLGSSAHASQGLGARALAEAVQARKTVSFGYTNSAGDSHAHSVDPYGVFFREGSWYLAGRDRDRDEVRTYAIARMTDIDVNPARPRTPDFERPSDFDVRQIERLPFQYGAEAVLASIRFIPDVAWRADRITRGQGDVDILPDGSAIWTVEARDLRRLASWIVDEGPGLHAVAPEELLETLVSGLRATVTAHD